MKNRDYTYLYGPVPSRRLGRSLGVDLVPLKICSYNCIYCQLGRTENTTIVRKEYIPEKEVVKEIQEWLRLDIKADYITMSGSGEPTLNSSIGNIIRQIKSLTDIPVAVITNGSLLSKKEVREDIMEADLVVPSLDAGTEKLFRYINRPDPEIDFEKMAGGLIDFSHEFQGKLWVEVFLVYPANTLEKELTNIRDILEKVDCSRIHLNTCARPPAEDFVDKAPPEKARLALDILGDKAEAVVDFAKELDESASGNVSQEKIINLLKRRPCSLEDISNSFNTSPNEVLKYITPMVKRGQVEIEDRERDRFYRISYYS